MSYPNATILACESNEVVVGLNGRAGSIIDKIGVRCAVLNSDGTLGDRRNGPDYGGSGGNAFNTDGASDCADGSVVYQVDGNLASWIGADRTGQIRFRCKSLEDASESWPLVSGTNYQGSSNDRGPFNFTCGQAPNNFGSYLNGIIIDNAGGSTYAGDMLGVTCR